MSWVLQDSRGKEVSFPLGVTCSPSLPESLAEVTLAELELLCLPGETNESDWTEGLQKGLEQMAPKTVKITQQL